MKLYIFGVLFILLAAGGIIDAQTPDNALTVKADANACELNSAQVDAIRSTVSQSRLRIFVIFRAGTGESDLVNKRRFEHVRRFLTERKGWNYLNVVYARGEDVNGLARIEFYMGGVPALVILSKRNMSPCMDCCGPDPLANATSLLSRKTGSKRHR